MRVGGLCASALALVILAWVPSIHAAELERSEQETLVKIGEEEGHDDEQLAGEAEEVEPAPITLGARGFGGVLVEGEETGPLFGGGLLAGFEVHEHIELEASLMVAATGESPAFAVVELIGKWVIEREQKISPHLLLGPLFSVDFKHPVAFSAGLVAGGGATFWMTPRIGIVSDLTYRLLIGAELGHAGTAALGLSWRPF